MKKRLIMFFVIALTSIIFNPLNVEAKRFECNYNFNNNSFKYTIENGSLIVPFESNKIINEKTYYNSENLKDNFIKSSKTSKGQIICPTLMFEENDLFTTIFVNGKDDNNCNGKCTLVNSNTENKVKVEETKMLKAIGIYKSDAYFIPTVRKLSDNSIEWSINNSEFYSIKDKISLNNNSLVAIDEKLVKNLFTNEETSNKIYRCISQSGKKYSYYLTEDKNTCKNDLSKIDNQGEKSLSYNGAKGNPNVNCKSTILGDPKDESSVAWLLQQVLNYLKVLGPMIILVMSAIDFTKAIIHGDDETLQKCYKKLITRLILAVVLFFLPTLVELLLEIFGFIGDPICVLS